MTKTRSVPILAFCAVTMGVAFGCSGAPPGTAPAAAPPQTPNVGRDPAIDRVDNVGNPGGGSDLDSSREATP